VKGHKNKILTRPESRPAYRTGRHSSRLDVFYFLPTAHFLKQFYCLTTNGTFAFTLTHEANPSAKSKEPFLANAPIKRRILTNYFKTRQVNE